MVVEEPSKATLTPSTGLERESST